MQFHVTAFIEKKQFFYQVLYHCFVSIITFDQTMKGNPCNWVLNAKIVQQLYNLPRLHTYLWTYEVFNLLLTAFI